MADLVPADDLPADLAPSATDASAQSNLVPADDLPTNLAPSEPANQASAEPNDTLGATEGALRGLTGGLSDVALKGARNLAEQYSNDPDFWAPKAEDVTERANTAAGTAGEIAGVASGFMTGTGVPGLISGGVKSILPEATSMLGKIGSKTIQGALEMGALQSTDELSKAMLGQGDPETPVSSAIAHIGAAGLIGGLLGGGFGAIGAGGSSALSALENSKMGTKAANILGGMGAAAKAHAAGIPEEAAEEYITKSFKDIGANEFNYNDYKPGVKLYYSGVQKAVNRAADFITDSIVGGTVAAKAGPIIGTATSILSDKYIAPVVEKILQKPLIGVTKLALPTIMYALSKGETSGLFNALNHATQVAKGARAITNGVESVFKGGGQQIVNISDKDKKKITDYIDNGGFNQEMQNAVQDRPTEPQETPAYAKGGKVTSTAPMTNGHLGTLYPDQMVLMNAAKGRMSNYLNSLKPQTNPQKLPFDRAPDTKYADKRYDEAVNIAGAPLSILKHIKDGTLQVDHMKHLNSMYPELTQHLQKKLTERMMNAQLDEEAPAARTKQSLAMFLGAPLETYMTPQGIMAAQSTFAPKQTPQQGQMQGKTKKGTSTLGKSNKQYQTPNQAGEQDQAKRD